MQVSDTVYVDGHTAECDGGGVLGHPRVYLNMGDENSVECPYCGRTFIHKPEQQTANANG